MKIHENNKIVQTLEEKRFEEFMNMTTYAISRGFYNNNNFYHYRYCVFLNSRMI